MPSTARHGRVLEELAIAAAELATYCDHVEHAEPAHPDVLLRTGQRLLEAAVTLADLEDVDLLEAYAVRLDTIEEASVRSDHIGGDDARQATTWRELQLVQLDHDRRYHPDVAGLARAEQLRHYAFHLAKLTGALARYARGTGREELRTRRLPDTLLFAIKLWTVTGQKLPQAALREANGTIRLPPVPDR